ncbi:MAG: patatin-like phospholipase family protein [Campylobacter sp.]|nr:patatin-like phospholipase family protein [Campylobacter sp.]
MAVEISLCLAGGAARGAFHLGILARLDENNVCVKALSGSSIGAFVAVLYASGFAPREILDLIKSREFKKAFGLNFKLTSIAKIKQNSPIIQNLIKFKDLKELPIPTFICALDLKSGVEHYFSSGDTLKITLGSCSVLPVFEPIKYSEFMLADGGFANNLPILPLKNLPYPIVAIDLHPINEFNKTGLIATTKRACIITMNKRSQLSKNECEIYINNPKLDKFSLFKFRGFDEMFELGYESAKEIITHFQKRTLA